uniref:Uncharacterized protein n=1 Tax=Panagrolaimus sp. JU765 TaxID=591449 RepID=A0AC34QU46_9BILA
MSTKIAESDAASIKFSFMTESMIERCLHHFEYSDAVTLAEVYYDQVKSDSACVLFARALYLHGSRDQACDLIEKHGYTSAELRYLLARFLYELKNSQRAMALLRNSNGSDLHSCFKGSDQEPFAHSLLASLMKETGDKRSASKQYHKSVVIAPILWSNVKNYCDLGGDDIRATLHGYDILHDNKSISSMSTSEHCTKIEDSLNDGKKSSTRKSPSRLTIRRRAGRLSPIDPSNTRYMTRNKVKNALTPSKRTKPSLLMEKSKLILEEAKIGVHRRHEEAKIGVHRRHGLPLSSVNNPSTIQPQLILSKDDESESEQMDVENHEPRERKPLAEIEIDCTQNEQIDDVYEKIYGYIVEMTGVQLHLSKYRFEDAMEALNKLSPGHSILPLSLELLGRVLFEKSDFQRSSKIFAEMHKLYPHRIDGLEIYSSCLWQLNDVTTLSALSKDLMKKFRHRPETWCVTGNLYSLEKQCAIAIECFDRATKLFPKIGYSYYLLGNELIEVGHLDRAITAFHQALDISPEDYRPHLGLGTIEQKRSQVEKALLHMRNAVEKNQSNIILKCHLAVCEQAIGNEKEALTILEKALKMDPNHLAARFHRAKLLFDMKKYEEAKLELLRLKDMSPNESHVFFLLGRVYKKLGDAHRSLIYYNFTSQIDPKGEQLRGLTQEQRFDEDDLDSETIARLTRA